MSYLKVDPASMDGFREVKVPFADDEMESLKAGELVALSGVMYTGRDQTHRRLIELLEQGRDLPVDLRGQMLYYVGPTPAPPGRMIGSAGPTTSYRMDSYTPRLLDLGLKATLGKGRRGRQVRDAMLKTGAVYLASIAGAGALLARSIVKAEVVAFEDAGPEAMFRFEVDRFLAVVINDLEGRDFYRICAGASGARNGNQAG